MLNFEQRTEAYISFIEEYLDRQFLVDDNPDAPPVPQKTLYDAMRYSLLAGGKRLRPIFVLDFCRMCGGDWQKAIPFAAAVEMVHTYSLIHDDLPCMDNDDFRRGKPTNHKVFGEATAVLAGDALLTEAFFYVSNAPYDGDIRARAVAALAAGSGAAGMVGGQILDMQSESRICTEQEVLNIQSRKTGALIQAACALGVLAGNGTKLQMKAAYDFAARLGLAFQIRDDMLDVIGNAGELGKAVGVDANKNTFVHLYGLDTCEKLVCEYTQQAVSCLAFFEDNGYMTTLAQKLTGRTR